MHCEVSSDEFCGDRKKKISKLAIPWQKNLFTLDEMYPDRDVKKL